MDTIFYISYLALVAWVVFQLGFPFVTVLGAQLFGSRFATYKVAPREQFATCKVAPREPDYACIITAYRNAGIARPLVESLLRQSYPQHIIYLVADECPAFDFGIADVRYVPLRPEPPLRLKVKSIRYAVERFQRPHTHIAVFDADNLAHPLFLEEINRYVQAGQHCIQGQRTAKNLDSDYAAADSLGELYKNYIERYCPTLLGGSAVISGSGMATESALYRAYLDSPEIAAGQHQGKKMLQEDKILQNFLLRQDCRIAYAPEAVCFDEKVTSGEAVQTQRARWLFSYFQNIPNALGILRRGLLRGSWNQAFFGIVTLALPMFLQLGLAAVLALVGLWVAPRASAVLAGAVLVFAGTVLWTLRLSGAPQAVWQAIWAMPQFVWRQARALVKMNNPNKHFKHTEHNKYVSVDEVTQSKP